MLQRVKQFKCTTYDNRAFFIKHYGVKLAFCCNRNYFLPPHQCDNVPAHFPDYTHQQLQSELLLWREPHIQKRTAPQGVKWTLLLIPQRHISKEDLVNRLFLPRNFPSQKQLWGMHHLLKARPLSCERACCSHIYQHSAARGLCVDPLWNVADAFQVQKCSTACLKKKKKENGSPPVTQIALRANYTCWYRPVDMI